MCVCVVLLKHMAENIPSAAFFMVYKTEKKSHNFIKLGGWKDPSYSLSIPLWWWAKGQCPLCGHDQLDHFCATSMVGLLISCIDTSRLPFVHRIWLPIHLQQANASSHPTTPASQHMVSFNSFPSFSSQQFFLCNHLDCLCTLPLYKN